MLCCHGMPSSLVGECLSLAALSHGPTYRLYDGLARVNPRDVALVRPTGIRVVVGICAFGRPGGGSGDHFWCERLTLQRGFSGRGASGTGTQTADGNAGSGALARRLTPDQHAGAHDHIP